MEMESGKFQGQNSMDEEFEFLQIEDEEIAGLSHWEFIDASDADSEYKDEEANGSDGPDGPSIEPSSVSSSISPISSLVAGPIGGPRTPLHRPKIVRFLDVAPYFKPHHHDYDVDVDDDEGHDDDDGYGLDDELVPWAVGDKLGRQRMRKLGKRTFPKMNNSKRSPYLLARPGCVRGKHGLGLKHIY